MIRTVAAATAAIVMMTGLLVTEVTAEEVSEEQKTAKAVAVEIWGREAGWRLIERWVLIVLWSSSTLEAELVKEHKTVAGYPMFAGAEIRGRRSDKWKERGDTLYLWVTSVDVAMAMPNWSFFADANDVFSVWCGCLGTTVIGLDFRHMGGGEQQFMRFRFNPESGRSELVR